MFILRDLLPPLQTAFPATPLGRKRAQWFLYTLLAVIVPEQGNFSAGRTQWLLEPRGAQVLVRYRAELVPDFTLPPIIGTTLVRQALARELRTVLEHLERLAQSSRPPSPS